MFMCPQLKRVDFFLYNRGLIHTNELSWFYIIIIVIVLGISHKAILS